MITVNYLVCSAFCFGSQIAFIYLCQSFFLVNITLTKVVERIYFDIKYLCQSYLLDEYNFDKGC